MPLVHSLSVLAIAALTASVNAGFGPALSTGPVGSGSWIRESTSTLILPKAPTGNTGDLALWVGMGTSGGDLIQSIADNHEQSNWNVFAYTLMHSGNEPNPVRSPGANASANDAITMHYKYDDTSKNYTQIVSVNGKQVSTISTSDGQAEGWGSAVECASGICGSVPAHKWVNTTITLNTADPNYVQTLSKGDGVTGDMTTKDGGITWKITDINIPAFTFTTAD